LTNWRTYPPGSIERAKALGLELLATSTSLEVTYDLWETTRDVVAREEAWKPLGLKSCGEFIKAVTGRTDSSIVKKITKTEAIRQRRSSNPHETQQQTADAVGCSRKHVVEVMQGVTKKSDSNKEVTPPEWITRRDLQAAFRKLPADERERLEALPDQKRRGAVRQAAIAAGIVKVPTVIDKLRAAWKKATKEERLAFLEEIAP
jgi:hypothetical protein